VKLLKLDKKEIFMNFNNITKIAAVALLFASTSIFAVYVPKGPLHLHIQNNTDYNFNIKQHEIDERPLRDEIKAHQEKTFNQLPLLGDRDYAYAYFILRSGDIAVGMKFIVSEEGSDARAVFYASSRTNFDSLYTRTNIPEPTTDDEYDVYLTLEGNKENGFAGSSIKVKFEVR
jgi:hypothetical protein